MRTNIVIDDKLLEEAFSHQLSQQAKIYPLSLFKFSITCLPNKKSFKRLLIFSHVSRTDYTDFADLGHVTSCY